ncbi:MAG: hypothetical protein E6J14_08810 [Chloroflexi bacterium]|nr:MAG: hypothetical protein E6J14_08810 [Chloroflexota bacterium]
MITSVVARPVAAATATGLGSRARSARLAWLLGAAGLTLAFTTQPFRDPDVWWHLAIGRLITAHGIPSLEPFSFLPAANPWGGQQWGYEVMLARLVGSGGPGLAMLVMGVLGSAALLVAALAAPRRVHVPAAWLAASMVICGLIAAQVMGVRGQVITVLGTALVLLVVSRWREGFTSAVWALPPLFAVWANLHAGFVTGLAVLVLMATTVAVHRRTVAGSEAAARLRPLLLATAASAVLTLATPAGPHLYGYVAQTFGNPTLTQNITEWMPPDFHAWDMRLFELVAAGLLVLWAMHRRPDPVDVVLAGVAFAATLQAQRNVALFAVVALPQLAGYGWQAWSARRTGTRRPRTALPAVVALACTAAVCAATVVEIAPRLSRSAAADYETQHEPRAAADYVATHLAGQHLYSTYEWGGYLAYRFPDQRVVYIYGESAVFGSARLQQYLDIHLVRAAWHQRLGDAGIHAAVVPAASQETTAFLEAGWTVSCHDPAGGAVVMQSGGEPPTTQPLDPTTAPACRG